MQYTKDCPTNNEHKLFLLRAESARIAGESFKAIKNYSQAKMSAKTNQFIQYEALADELAGRYDVTQKSSCVPYDM